MLQLAYDDTGRWVDRRGLTRCSSAYIEVLRNGSGFSFRRGPEGRWTRNPLLALPVPTPHLRSPMPAGAVRCCQRWFKHNAYYVFDMPLHNGRTTPVAWGGTRGCKGWHHVYIERDYDQTPRDVFFRVPDDLMPRKPLARLVLVNPNADDARVHYTRPANCPCIRIEHLGTQCMGFYHKGRWYKRTFVDADLYTLLKKGPGGVAVCPDQKRAPKKAPASGEVHSDHFKVRPRLYRRSSTSDGSSKSSMSSTSSSEASSESSDY